MSISELGSIGEFIASIAVLLSLIYVAFQVRQNTSAMKIGQSQEFIRWNTEFCEPIIQDKELMDLWRIKMPFGKYEGTLLASLPIHYLEWFAREGFPKGKLGRQLSLVHTLKTNGHQDVLNELRTFVNDEVD